MLGDRNTSRIAPASLSPDPSEEAESRTPTPTYSPESPEPPVIYSPVSSAPLSPMSPPPPYFQDYVAPPPYRPPIFPSIRNVHDLLQAPPGFPNILAEGAATMDEWILDAIRYMADRLTVSTLPPRHAMNLHMLCYSFLDARTELELWVRNAYIGMANGHPAYVLMMYTVILQHLYHRYSYCCLRFNPIFPLTTPYLNHVYNLLLYRLQQTDRSFVDCMERLTARIRGLTDIGFTLGVLPNVDI